MAHPARDSASGRNFGIQSREEGRKDGVRREGKGREWKRREGKG